MINPWMVFGLYIDHSLFNYFFQGLLIRIFRTFWSSMTFHRTCLPKSGWIEIKNRKSRDRKIEMPFAVTPINPFIVLSLWWILIWVSSKPYFNWFIRYRYNHLLLRFLKLYVSIFNLQQYGCVTELEFRQELIFFIF